MKKYLITFGIGSAYATSCLILSSDDEEKIRHYVFSKYGRMNVCGIYDYEKHKDYVQKYHYQIIEEKTI